MKLLLLFMVSEIYISENLGCFKITTMKYMQKKDEAIFFFAQTLLNKRGCLWLQVM
jgi:hypothetical protein